MNSQREVKMSISGDARISDNGQRQNILLNLEDPIQANLLNVMALFFSFANHPQISSSSDLYKFQAYLILQDIQD